jgi:hypothetical protein
MPRVKIQLADNIKRVVTVNTDATVGATVGTDLYLNGAVATPTTLSQWLGLTATGGSANIRNGYGILIAGTNPKTINVDRSAAFAWQGQHQWEEELWGPNGTAAAPAFTFTADPDTGIYRVGANQLGLSTGGTLRWDVNTTRVYQTLPLTIESNSGWYARSPARDAGTVLTLFDTSGHPEYGIGSQLAFWEDPDRLYGIRLRHTGESLNEGNLDFYRHNNDATGVLFLRMTRDSSQVQFAAGTSSAPSVSFMGDLDLGLYSAGADQLGISALTSVTHVANGTATGIITYNLNASSTAGYTVADENAVARVRLGYSNNTDRPFLNVPSAVDMTFQQGGTVMIDFLQAGHWRTRDGIELRAGTGDDLRLFHDGTNSTIRNDTGNLSILSGATEVIRFTQSNPRVVAHVGAVGTPSFSFIGDENTGMYRVGADQLGLVAGGAVGAQVDLTSTAGNTRLLIYDVDNATLERVTVGAADSGGTGFKVLRIPN